MRGGFCFLVLHVLSYDGQGGGSVSRMTPDLFALIWEWERNTHGAFAFPVSRDQPLQAELLEAHYCSGHKIAVK
jgi:hypothetical protein